MGQVAIDLPDPLSNSAAASGPGVDDLLAQLAGEEIDRLLAEADVERPAQAEAPAVLVITPEGLQPLPSGAPISQGGAGALAPSGVPMGNANARALAPSAADPVEPQAEMPAAAPVPMAAVPMPVAPLAQADVEELDARVAQELNSLFTELDSDEPAPPAAKAAPPPASAATTADALAEAAVAAVIAATPPAPSDPVAQAAALEKQLLGITLMEALGSAADVENDGNRLRAINLSFVLKPLEWINAPLSACSDTLREGLGKVAIMTLFNALAILLYVLFLRKH